MAGDTKQTPPTPEDGGAKMIDEAANKVIMKLMSGLTVIVIATLGGLYAFMEFLVGNQVEARIDGAVRSAMGSSATLQQSVTDALDDAFGKSEHSADIVGALSQPLTDGRFFDTVADNAKTRLFDAGPELRIEQRLILVSQLIGFSSNPSEQLKGYGFDREGLDDELVVQEILAVLELAANDPTSRGTLEAVLERTRSDRKRALTQDELVVYAKFLAGLPDALAGHAARWIADEGLEAHDDPFTTLMLVNGLACGGQMSVLSDFVTWTEPSRSRPSTALEAFGWLGLGMVMSTERIGTTNCAVSQAVEDSRDGAGAGGAFALMPSGTTDRGETAEAAEIARQDVLTTMLGRTRASAVSDRERVLPNRVFGRDGRVRVVQSAVGDVTTFRAALLQGDTEAVNAICATAGYVSGECDLFNDPEAIRALGAMLDLWEAGGTDGGKAGLDPLASAYTHQDEPIRWYAHRIVPLLSTNHVVQDDWEAAISRGGLAIGEDTAQGTALEEILALAWGERITHDRRSGRLSLPDAQTLSHGALDSIMADDRVVFLKGRADLRWLAPLISNASAGRAAQAVRDLLPVRTQTAFTPKARTDRDGAEVDLDADTVDGESAKIDPTPLALITAGLRAGIADDELAPMTDVLEVTQNGDGTYVAVADGATIALAVGQALETGVSRSQVPYDAAFFGIAERLRTGSSRDVSIAERLGLMVLNTTFSEDRLAVLRAIASTDLYTAAQSAGGANALTRALSDTLPGIERLAAAERCDRALDAQDVGFCAIPNLQSSDQIFVVSDHLTPIALMSRSAGVIHTYAPAQPRIVVPQSSAEDGAYLLFARGDGTNDVSPLAPAAAGDGLHPVLTLSDLRSYDWSVGADNPLTAGTSYEVDITRFEAAVFSIVQPALGEFVTVETTVLSEGVDTTMTLYASDGTELDYDDDGGTGLASRMALTGGVPGETLRLVVNTIGSGGTFEIALAAETLAVVSVSADAAEPTSRTLRFADDGVDVPLVLDVPVAGTYVMSTTDASEGVDTTMTLYDERNEAIGFDDDGGANLNSQLVVTLEPGTYVLDVSNLSRGAGDFTVEIVAVD